MYMAFLKDNPDKSLRGIRGPLIHYEEDGLFPNLEDAWNINRKAVEDGDVALDTCYQDWRLVLALRVLKSYFITQEYIISMGINNVYDRNTNSDIKCGFFWGAYLIE